MNYIRKVSSAMKFIFILCIFVFMLCGQINSECCNTRQDMATKELMNWIGAWDNYKCCNDCSKPKKGSGLGIIVYLSAHSTYILNLLKALS
uniref:Uncharacterized protein n=1 Tax=Romanomermis culicivorax TaxID=13658 RepID=A0A915K557_ROMCU